MKKAVVHTICALALVGLVALFCSSPKNPTREKSNADVDLLLAAPDSADSVYMVGDTLDVGVYLFLADGLDSVYVELGSYFDTTLSLVDVIDDDTVWVRTPLQSTGTDTVSVVAYLMHGLVKEHWSVVSVHGYSPELLVDLERFLRKTENQPCSLSVRVDGTAPFSFEWYHGEKPLTADSANPLILPSVQLGDSGLYHVRVSNPWGSVNSKDSWLVVKPEDAPPAPEGVTIVSKDGGNATLVWGSVEGATEYAIYRDTAQLNPEAKTVESSQDTSEIVTTGDFYYWVAAIKDDKESYFSKAVYAGERNQPPSWDKEVLSFAMVEGEDTLLALTSLCADPNTDDTLRFALAGDSGIGTLVGDSAFLFAAGRYSADTYIERLAATDGELSDTLTVVFEVDPGYHTLQLTSSAHGGASADPEKDKYRWGDTITVTATPEEGYKLDHWGGDIASAHDTSLTVVMDRDRSLIASFVAFAVAECQVIRPGSSVNDKIVAVVESNVGQGTICPEPGVYNDRLEVTGKVEFLVR